MSILSNRFIPRIINFLKPKIEAKQDKLVSGQNIKTINGTSLLGGGDITIEGGGNIDTSGTYPNMTVGKANKLSTARTISLSGGATGTATSFDGSKNINIPVTSLSDLSLTRVYKDNGKANSLSLMDLASPIFASNRLAFNNPNSILIYKSNDGGATWVDYGATDEQKTKFVSGLEQYIYIGGKTTGQIAEQDKLRVILTEGRSAYTSIEEFLFYVTSSGALSCKCKLSYITIAQYNADLDYNAQTYTEITTKEVAGWSEWNRLIQSVKASFGSTNNNNNIKAFLLEFWFENYRSGYENKTAFYISQFIGIGKNVYGNYTKCEMMNSGHLYNYDWQKNATFPAAIKATKHITQGGTVNQVVLGDGTLKALSEISPITDADADILLDNHIHSINVNTNGNDVNISVIESSKNGNNWETEDNDIPIPLATPTSAGVMSKEDKAKLDGNISIEPDSGMPDFIGDFEYSDVDYEAIIDLTTVDWINWVEGGLFMMNAEETWEEDNGDTSYHQCVVTFIYRSNGCIPISIVNTNKMTAKMSGMVITINLTEGTGELRFKQIKLI